MSSGFPTAHDRSHDSAPESSNRSFGDLVGDVIRGFSTLLRQEVELAKVELAETVKQARVGAGMLGGAGYAALMAIFFLSVALMWALADALESIPGGAIIVALIWLIVAVVLGVLGKKKMDEVEGMPRTVDSMKKIPETVTRNEDHR